jgi:hypothetical protein
MTAEQFTYWLQGFMELTNMNHLEPNQFQIVKDHLKLVFDKQTPDRSILKPTLPDIARPYPGPYTTNPSQYPLTNPTPYNPNTVICSAGDISLPTNTNDNNGGYRSEETISSSTKKMKFEPYPEGWLESLNLPKTNTNDNNGILLC